jgi:hypothetical protein
LRLRSPEKGTKNIKKNCPLSKTHGKVPKRAFLDVFSPSEFKSEFHLSLKNPVLKLANLLTLAVQNCIHGEMLKMCDKHVISVPGITGVRGLLIAIHFR